MQEKVRRLQVEARVEALTSTDVFASIDCQDGFDGWYAVQLPRKQFPAKVSLGSTFMMDVGYTHSEGLTYFGVTGNVQLNQDCPVQVHVNKRRPQTLSALDVAGQIKSRTTLEELDRIMKNKPTAIRVRI